MRWLRRLLRSFVLFWIAVCVGAAKEIALTFDDAPCQESYATLPEVQRINEKILRALRRSRAPATVFANENKLFWRGEREARVAILEQWIAAGHEVGNHTASHGKLSAVGPEAFCRDVVAGERTVNALLAARGKRMRFFRFPALDRGQGEDRQRVEKFLQRRGYTIAPITIDPRDWEFNARQRPLRERGKLAEAALVRRQFLASLHEQLATVEKQGRREILLLHLCTLTADCIDDILAMVQAHGMTPCTLERALGGSTPPPGPTHGRRSRHLLQK
jgi:peptidoglycan/xylan/chitin deacetylase (PgdA/CDA1 family)